MITGLAGLAVCIRNDGYSASLERFKIYKAIEDTVAKQEGMLRIIDESGEDYLYPESYFVFANLPEAVEKAVLEAA
ncbi:MAG: hypothetical protein FJ319_00160 [SAR202 cluster bacterium]|nr:hypothetical protein [SAR202 cluster bacterium]